MYSNRTVRETVGPDIDLRTSLSGVDKLILAAGGDLETKEQKPFHEPEIERLRRLFTDESSREQIIVLPHVGHFAIRNGGFLSDLDGWGEQTLVIYREDTSTCIAAFFSDERVERYWLPRLPDGQISVRRPEDNVLVVDLFLADGSFVGGMGVSMGQVPPYLHLYQTEGKMGQSNVADG